MNLGAYNQPLTGCEAPDHLKTFQNTPGLRSESPKGYSWVALVPNLSHMHGQPQDHLHQTCESKAT